MILFLILGAFSLDSILNQPELSSAHFGIYILKLDKDSVIYSYNATKLFSPASNMKIITTGAALYFLGPEFRFKTRLGLRGKLKDNYLLGDIIIMGGGDPKFSLTDLSRFISTIKKLDINNIKGNIVVVDDYFTDERLPVGWAWHYLDACYAPEISALSMNKNCVNVKIGATSIGRPAQVLIEPETKYVKLLNKMVTKPGDDSIIIYRKPEANIIYVDGGIGLGHKKNIEVAVKDPAMFVGIYFREKLQAEKIEFSGRVLRENGSRFFLSNTQSQVIFIDSVISPSLGDIIKETNIESENLYAEIILKALGAQKYNEGSFGAGISVLKDFLWICGVDTGNVSLWDGSGLSRHNLVSPYNLVMILRYIYHQGLFKNFYESLPRPGLGTLEYRFNGFPDSLCAKTGGLHAVSCLSGYLTIDGSCYGFSMLFNNFTCASKKIARIQEQILSALVEWLKRGT